MSWKLRVAFVISSANVRFGTLSSQALRQSWTTSLNRLTSIHSKTMKKCGQFCVGLHCQGQAAITGAAIFNLFALNLLPEATTLKLEPWEYLSGHQFPFYQWLREHLSEYGFFFPYDKDRGGVAAEPWHVSHISTADDFLQSLTTETLRQQLELHPIDGQAHVLANLDLIYNQFIANICSLESVCKSS